MRCRAKRAADQLQQGGRVLELIVFDNGRIVDLADDAERRHAAVGREQRHRLRRVEDVPFAAPRRLALNDRLDPRGPRGKEALPLAIDFHGDLGPDIEEAVGHPGVGEIRFHVQQVAVEVLLLFDLAQRRPRRFRPGRDLDATHALHIAV